MGAFATFYVSRFKLGYIGPQKNRGEMLDTAKELAKYAGKLITGRYFRKGVDVTWKSDATPLTRADMDSHNFLVSSLERAFQQPVVSEENRALQNPPPGTDFWLVDPLDGSQGFIEGSGDFCINIAFIQDGEPLIGVIYAPIYDELYYAQKGKGAFLERGRLKIPLPIQSPTHSVVVRSRHYDHEDVDRFIKVNTIDSQVIIGAAIKFAHLASGRATHYPRYRGSREWDTAAGHVILTESGGKMIDLTTGKSPTYNKPGFQNNFFLACAKTIEVERLQVLF
jgi:3'(2'), 5'-bisphosphate nucleotidase